MRFHFCQQGRCRQAGFSLIEAVICMSLLLLIVISVYTGITFGFNTIRTARENTRATQILIERAEQIRLFNWEQLTDGTNAYISTNKFLVPYYSTNLGVTYTGQVTIKPITIAGVAGTPGLASTSSYSNDMRQVSISVSWQTGGLVRSRKLTTYVSRYGLQNYIY